MTISEYLKNLSPDSAGHQFLSEILAILHATSVYLLENELKKLKETSLPTVY